MLPALNEWTIYQWSKLNNEREKLIAYISKEDNWPVKKKELVNKYLNIFLISNSPLAIKNCKLTTRT